MENKISIIVVGKENIESTIESINNEVYKNKEIYVLGKENKSISKKNNKKIEFVDNFFEIKIKQSKDNNNNITIDAGNQIKVGCEITLPRTIDVNSISTQVYYGKITSQGIVNDIAVTDMDFEGEENGINKFSAKIKLTTGGDYGYTFRVIPKNDMILNPMNLDLIKWITE